MYYTSATLYIFLAPIKARKEFCKPEMHQLVHVTLWEQKKKFPLWY